MNCMRSNIDLRNLTREVFERGMQPFCGHDRLHIEAFGSELILTFRRQHQPNRQTSIHSRFHLQANQVWIGSIFVAEHYRLRGFGRQLVAAVENTARHLEMAVVRVLPTPSSVVFWTKLGFLPDPRAARILNKSLRKDSGYVPIALNRST